MIKNKILIPIGKINRLSTSKLRNIPNSKSLNFNINLSNSILLFIYLYVQYQECLVILIGKFLFNNLLFLYNKDKLKYFISINKIKGNKIQINSKIKNIFWVLWKLLFKIILNLKIKTNIKIIKPQIIIKENNNFCFNLFILFLVNNQKTYYFSF